MRATFSKSTPLTDAENETLFGRRTAVSFSFSRRMRDLLQRRNGADIEKNARATPRVKRNPAGRSKSPLREDALSVKRFSVSGVLNWGVISTSFMLPYAMMACPLPAMRFCTCL